MFFGRFKLQPEKIMTRKKKVQSSGRRLKPMFFGGFKLQPEKITTRKKRYSRLADGWNKSQITICRVKIRTPIITKLEKITTGKKRYSRLVVGWSTKHKTQHAQTQQPTRWAVPPYVFNSTILFGGVNWWHLRTPIRCLPGKRIIVFQNCLN